FFFQAEDGIRDFHVTGVQTCALPISNDSRMCVPANTTEAVYVWSWIRTPLARCPSTRISSTPAPVWTSPPCDSIWDLRAWVSIRSEERRVGKEGRCKWTAERE